jgi:hypothetical protein
MTARRTLALTTGLGILLSLSLRAAWGHEGAPGEHRVELHVGTEHEECYFDLHPELTEAELKEFAAEGGQMVRYRQLSSADTLGAGHFEVSLGYAYFFLDDTKGAWNNTMSHPTDDHYLGEQLGFPQLQLRLGVTDRVDTELYGTVNWMSNYGFLGVASKIRVLEQGGKMPVSLAVRPSVSALLGPEEIQAYNASVDVAVGRSFGGFAPFAGVTFSSTLVIESSSDTDVGNTAAASTLAFAGVEYRWKHLSAAAQAEISEVPGLALRVGGTF